MFMAMYMFHIAFGIGLIALVMGLAMTKCCCSKAACDANAGKCCGCGGCGKWCGIIISILAIISLGCTVNSGYKQMNSPMMMDMEKAMNDRMDEMHKMKDEHKQ
jgi:hypothetical protein